MKKNLSSRIIDPVNAYFLTLSPTTINSSKYRVAQFCDFIYGTSDYSDCDWSSFKYTDLLTFIEHEKDNNKAFTSINAALSALKGVAFHAWQLNIISVDQYMKIKTIKRLKGYRLPAGRALEVNEISKPKSQKSSNPLINTRNFAMFAIGCCCGLRRIEIQRLNIENIKDDRVTVIGKFNKQRTIYFNEFVRQALNEWLSILKRDTGALFVNIKKGGEMGDRLAIISIHRIITEMSENLGTERFTSHDLRRTFITHLLDNNADKFSVKRLGGYSSVDTIEIYDRRDQKIDKETIKLLPY